MPKPVILSVDDEFIILDALKDQLDNEFSVSYQIETSEEGADAVEFCEELIEDGIDIPVVIVDYIMPGMKGDELLEKIHKISPETLTILLTGQANLEGVTRAINFANLYRYIAKPWDQDDLILTVKEAIKSFYSAREIEQKNKELTELNASLEDKVKQRTQQLSELNATKDKFFSIIAHDLKNPFNALMGFSSLLIDSFDDYNDEEKLDLIQTMSDASENAYKLLQNLLEWSRSQTGSIKWNPDTIKLDQISKDTFALLENAALNKKISLQNLVPKNAKAYADGNMITTVIRNLLSNSLKYTLSGGEVKLYSSVNDNEIELTVEDNGVGIRKEDIHKLFRIDINFSTNGTNSETGTGLGLILCKEFVEKNGGKIWVESEQGIGSKFKFTLPITKN
ncbi:MAG: hypothetical protein CL663_04660 [Bacteroidetes bacterium]|nr:hypothetical protein [Bacteroidota bacterium]